MNTIGYLMILNSLIIMFALCMGFIFVGLFIGICVGRFYDFLIDSEADKNRKKRKHLRVIK